MIAYDETYNGKTARLVGKNGDGCASSLYNFRRRKNLPGATVAQCKLDVANRGYKHNIIQNNVNKPSPKKLSMGEVLHGSVALFDIIQGDVVDDITLRKRAAICAECPLISNTSDNCQGCKANKLAKYARNLAVKFGRNFIEPTITVNHLRPVKTAKIKEFYCGHCGCSVLNLCLSKSKHFLNKENESRPSNCCVHDLSL